MFQSYAMLVKYKDNLANNKEVYLRIKALPGAGKTEPVAEMADGTLKIAVAAAPEKGKANAELIKYLSKEFKAGKSDIKIISGAGDKLKLVKIII